MTDIEVLQNTTRLAATIISNWIRRSSLEEGEEGEGGRQQESASCSLLPVEGREKDWSEGETTYIDAFIRETGRDSGALFLGLGQ